MQTIAVAGHFNPLHVGHLQMINAARRIDPCGRLIVIVANDIQAAMKRTPVLISLQDRMMIMSCIKGVDQVIASIDETPSIKETLKLVQPDVLASGCAPNHPDAIEEEEICKSLGIKTVWNIGGNKIKSSSEILKKYAENKM